MENAAKPVSAPPARGLFLRVEQELTSAGLVELAPAVEHRIKVHTSGPARGECQSEAFVYAPGSVDILPAGSGDQWLQHDPSTSLTLSFPASLLTRVAAELGIPDRQVALEPRNHLRDARIEHIARALDSELGDPHPAGLLYVESLSTALAVHLIGRYRVLQTPRLRGLSRQQLKRVSEYIDAYLDRDLSLERLAGVAGLGMTNFKALFRRSTGQPVHAYVVQKRVERARALLARGDLPISQVALAAGFAHPSHMARTMRRLLGVVPSELARAETPPRQHGA